jgi:hypothetical protein
MEGASGQMTEEEEFEFRRRLEQERAGAETPTVGPEPKDRPSPSKFSETPGGAALMSRGAMGLGKRGDTMGDIHRARANLVQEAGERVTDATGSPARAARMNGDAEKAVQTLLDEGVNVTKGGVEGLTARIDTLDDALDQAIKGSTARLQKTDALKGLKDVIKEYKAGTMAAESLDDVRRVARNLIEHPLLRGKTDMSVQAAQAMKRQNYKELGDAAYGTGLKPSAERDALKAVTRSLKEGIERGTPEAGAINAEMSPLINARDLAQDRTLVAGNRDLLGISTMNPKTMLLSLADRSQLLKSLLARFLYSGVAPAVAPVGAATGGGIGSLLEQQGQK